LNARDFAKRVQSGDRIEGEEKNPEKAKRGLVQAPFL
jgi:hypothetical protein